MLDCFERREAGVEGAEQELVVGVEVPGERVKAGGEEEEEEGDVAG